MSNKTPGLHRDIFRPPTLLKMPFRKMNSLFGNLLQIQNFPEFLQNLNISGKTTSQKIMSFDAHSTANSAPLQILKKKHLFPKTHKLRTFWEILFQSHSTANLL